MIHTIQFLRVSQSLTISFLYFSHGRNNSLPMLPTVHSFLDVFGKKYSDVPQDTKPKAPLGIARLEVRVNVEFWAESAATVTPSAHG